MSDYTPRHQNREDASGNATLVAGVIAFLAALGALVYMESHGHPTTELMALAGPVIAALLVTRHVSKLTRHQNEKLETVVQQTNGQLDDRIRAQVLAALTEAGTGAPQAASEQPPSTSTMPPRFLTPDPDRRSRYLD
jgi:hypothetical protein